MTPKATIQSLYAAFATGDVPTVLSAFAPDIRWTEAAGFPYAGTYIGPQAILDGVFMRLATEWDAFAAVPQQLVAEGDTVIAIGEYSGTYKATNKPMRVPMVHVWTVTDGKITRFVQHTDTKLLADQIAPTSASATA
ncbi:MAG: nuclear transport factor 2 family protein [Acidobacteriaceae bacterium]